MWVNHQSWKCTNHFPSIHFPHTAKKCYIFGCLSTRPELESQPAPPPPPEPVALPEVRFEAQETITLGKDPRRFVKMDGEFMVSVGDCPVCGKPVAQNSKYCSQSCRKRNARHAYKKRMAEMASV